MKENMKMMMACVKIVANFGLQILHTPRYLTHLVI